MPTDENKGKIKNAWVWQKQLEADLQMLQDLRDLAEQITPVYSLAPGVVAVTTNWAVQLRRWLTWKYLFKAILGCLQRR